MEDKILEEKGESADTRIARISLPAMESINPDLKFTSEVEGDFPDVFRLKTIIITANMVTVSAMKKKTCPIYIHAYI